jgi:site-specific DNA recombinase
VAYLSQTLAGLSTGGGAAVSRRERIGAVPYGWKLAPDREHLEPEPAEQAVAAKARALRARGLALRSIGAELTRRGLLPRSGGRWHAETVAGLLRSEAAA